MLVILGRDIRHGLRRIAQAPGVAAVVIASLGVGIGVNTAVFTWIQARVLKPLPGVADGGSFQLLEPRGETGMYPGASWSEYRDLSARLTAFADLTASRLAPLTVGTAEWADRASGMLVSGNYFTAMDVGAAAGRLLTEADTARPGGEPVIVISYEFWQTRFAGTTGAIGQTLLVNDRPLTIVGVTAPGFRGSIMGLVVDFWVPATMVPVLTPGSRELDNRSVRGYGLMARLAPGVSRAEAAQDFSAAMRELAEAYPASNRAIDGELLAFWQSPRGPQRSLITALALLQGVMLLVLLAVCGNMASLLLARTSVRTSEIALRLALGAPRTRIVSLLMTESLLLSAGGVVLGVVVAIWGTDAMRAVPMPSPMGLRIQFDTSVDLVSLAFAAGLGVIAGVLIGVAPAWHLARVDATAGFRAPGIAGGRNGLRDAVMVVQVALAVVVLTLAATFLRQFTDTQTTDPGFRRDGLMLATYDLRGRSRSVGDAEAREFARLLVDRLRAAPGVEAAAIATAVPLDIHGLPMRVFSVEGFARTDDGFDSALSLTVTPEYFETMGIAVVDGRTFQPLDAAGGPEAVVNETFVRRHVPPPAVAIGRRVDIGGTAYTIAGVVKDSLYNAYGEPPTAAIYLSYRDRPSGMGEIHVRTRAGAEAAVVPAMREALRSIDAALPLFNARTLHQHVDRNLFFQRVPARLFVVIGPLIVVLVAVGVYAVVSHTVTQRRVDISVRLALGAGARRVIADLTTRSLRVVGLGLGAGLVLAYAMAPEPGRTLQAMPALLFAPVLLFAVTALASWWPARRVSAIDPMQTLKQM